jgi:hypothetical protein
MSSATAYASSNLYDIGTNIAQQNWFGVIDCFQRVARCLVLFVFLVVTQPVAFFRFSLAYNRLWYGKIFGTVSTVLFYGCYPIIIFLVMIAKKMKKLFTTVESFDDGNVFFVSPKNPLAALFWDFYKDISVYVGLFLMCGVDQNAVDHSWYDVLVQKDYWRGLLTRAGARVPREMGRWDGSHSTGDRLKMHHDVMGDTVEKLVVKLPDSYLGIGDLYLTKGEPKFEYGKNADGTERYEGGYNSVEELESILEEGKYYENKDGVMILEFIVPATDQECHTLDILTVKTAANGVQLVSCLYWGDCADGNSSHSTRAGYTVDVENEIIKEPARWYSAHFATFKPKPGMIGKKLPGVKEAVNKCLKSHSLIEHKWLKMAGWDALLTNHGAVFFEGNFAAHRNPRRIFLSWNNLWTYIQVAMHELNY